ncbi:ribosome recycling factor [bacterium]|jgi:ribosome recycling factor|nr:ribosome recycling factor [bacterium]
MSDINERMEKTVKALNSNLGTIRTGRASTDLLSRIMVNYYGAMTPLNQVASVTVPENSMLLINVFDSSAVQSVEKAIQISDLGINPQVDGSSIRLRLPDLTEERRRDLVKQVRKVVEESRISLRNVRRDCVDEIKLFEKEKEISEDDARKETDNVQKTLDVFMKKIDSILAEKESEILRV